MQRNGIVLEAERLVTLQQTIRESAQVVYDITEKLIDAVPDETRNPDAGKYVDFAYDELMQADKLLEMARILLSLKSYPRYTPERNSWTNLRERSDEQRTRLDQHLGFVCLRDSGDLKPRKDAAEAVLNGMLKIFDSRDVLFQKLEINHTTQKLCNDQIRVLDGIIETSLDYVETIAGVVRRSTQITPRR